MCSCFLRYIVEPSTRVGENTQRNVCTYAYTSFAPIVLPVHRGGANNTRNVRAYANALIRLSFAHVRTYAFDTRHTPMLHSLLVLHDSLRSVSGGRACIAYGRTLYLRLMLSPKVAQLVTGFRLPFALNRNYNKRCYIASSPFVRASNTRCIAGTYVLLCLVAAF